MTAPQGQLPEGAIGVDGLRGLQSMTPDSVRSSMRSPFDSLISDLQSKMQNGLVGGIVKLVQGIVPAGFEAHQAFADGQRAIKDLVSRLSPLEEYASAYMPSTEGLWQGGRLPFTEVLVGSKGVTAYSGRFILNDYGMWRIDCQIWPSNYAVGMISAVEWEIRVLRPDGSVYHRKRSRHVDTDSLPDKLTTTVVVPAVGYSVEVQVTSIAPLRGMRGGADRTHLTVHHINRNGSTSGPTGETG